MPFKPKKFFLKTLKDIPLTFSSLLLTVLILLGCVYFFLAWHLPNVDELRDVHLQVPLRIYTADGKLIGEYGAKRRMPITLNQAPKQLINGILDTEDQRFYEHPGVDFISLVRAAKKVFSTGRKSQGASTITMQVARNFFLSSTKTYTRKIKEILLALIIDQEFSKKEILQLYINKIYLGQRAYGVAAAAQIYYGKGLKQLTLPQLAMIAGLPQAPSRDNPIVNPRGALARRNHVLQRMYENDHISAAKYKAAIKAPITAHYHRLAAGVAAPYVAEMVRAAMVRQFGKDVYDAGFTVYTTINSRLQKIADQALYYGVLSYDKRHGYRGQEQNLGTPTPENLADLQKKLQSIPVFGGLSPAVVISVNQQSANAMLRNGKTITIGWNGLAWARQQLSDNSLGRAPLHAIDVVKPGDVIRVQKSAARQWLLTQAPKVNGALVALNPNTGAILALNGGFSYRQSKYNRATQAGRQTGSVFKPFIYSAALAKGFTLASIINDAPIVISDPGANVFWRPQNVTRRFYGPTRLRIGLIKSRNLVSVRLLQAIGVPYAIDYLKRFGFTPNQLPYGLSLALGTADISPVELVGGYATFANGGYRITPYFIATIKDQDGKIIFQAKPKVVPPDSAQLTAPKNQDTAKNFAERTLSSQNAYLITDALKDVIKRGTGRRARVLKRSDLAGKTGTTNDQKDAWFCGYNRNLVVATWVGFDKPRPLYEYGAQAALPMWTYFMGAALNGLPEHSLPEPENIVTARIDPKTGLLSFPGQRNAIFEKFTQATLPKQTAPKSVSSPPSTNTNAVTHIFHTVGVGGAAKDSDEGSQPLF